MKFPLRYLAVAGGLIVAAALVVGCEEEAAEVPLFPNSKVASLEGLRDTLDAMTGSALGGAEFEYQGYKAEASPEEITEFFKTEAGLSLMTCDTCGSQPLFIGNWVTEAAEDDTTLVRQIWMCPSCRSVKRQPYRLSEEDSQRQGTSWAECTSFR